MYFVLSDFNYTLVLLLGGQLNLSAGGTGRDGVNVRIRGMGRGKHAMGRHDWLTTNLTWYWKYAIRQQWGARQLKGCSRSRARTHSQLCCRKENLLSRVRVK